MLTTLDGGGRGSLVDSAHTGSLSGGDGHSDVSLFSPSASPRISDNPEVQSGGRVEPVSDGSDTVVQIDTTVWIVEDTALVALDVVCLDGDGDNLHGHGALESIGVVSSDILEA